MLYSCCTVSSESPVLLQAVPELPEDVLRLHADVGERSGLAQHRPPDHGRSAAGRGQEGPVENAVANDDGAHPGTTHFTLSASVRFSKIKKKVTIFCSHTLVTVL